MVKGSKRVILNSRSLQPSHQCCELCFCVWDEFRGVQRDWDYSRWSNGPPKPDWDCGITVIFAFFLGLFHVRFHLCSHLRRLRVSVGGGVEIKRRYLYSVLFLFLSRGSRDGGKIN